MSGERLSFLRSAALLSWYYKCPEARAASERAEAERGERVERFRSELIKIFGSKCAAVISFNGGCMEATVEDLRLIAYEYTAPPANEARTSVSLLGRCPSCGAEAMSEPFGDLAGLGRALEQFTPVSNHLCRGTLRDTPGRTAGEGSPE